MMMVDSMKMYIGRGWSTSEGNEDRSDDVPGSAAASPESGLSI